MKATEEKFLTFLHKEAQFKIPIYQRLYSWTYEHCQTLIEDITMLLDNPSIPIHFMGSVVYIDERGQATLSSTRELLVIDGQQRLTTFTIIFIILEDLVRKGNKELNVPCDPLFADKIKESCLINKYSKLQNKSKLILTRSDNDTLQQLINYGRKSIDNSESNIIVNYDFLEGKIKEILNRYSVDQFYDNLNKLWIVDVALFQNSDNPQQTFESLNATGKELEDGDLIRNFLLMNLLNEKQIDIYDRYWYPMEVSLKEKLTDFISNFLYMEKGISTNIKNLYKEFKIYFYNNYSRDRIDDIAARLLTFSKYYNLITGSSESINEDERLNYAISSLRRLGYDSYISLLLPILHEYKIGHVTETTENGFNGQEIKKISLNELIEIIKSIESYLLRRNICEIPTNTLNSVFRTLWSSVNKEDIKFSFMEKITDLEWSKRFPEDSEFKDSLINNTLYGKGFAKLILMELEKHENKEANESFEKFQIEHVLPKTDNDPDKLSEKWRQMLGQNWKEVRNTWVHKLGNLTLTGYNPEYSDYDFETKKTMENGYIQSSLRLNQEISKNSVWNEEIIKERADNLSQKVIQIWKFPMKRQLIFQWGSERHGAKVYRIAENGKERIITYSSSIEIDSSSNETYRQKEVEYRSFTDYWNMFVDDEHWLQYHFIYFHEDYKQFFKEYLISINQGLLMQDELLGLQKWLAKVENEN